MTGCYNFLLWTKPAVYRTLSLSPVFDRPPLCCMISYNGDHMQHTSYLNSGWLYTCTGFMYASFHLMACIIWWWNRFFCCVCRIYNWYAYWMNSQQWPEHCYICMILWNYGGPIVATVLEQSAVTSPLYRRREQYVLNCCLISTMGVVEHHNKTYWEFP